MVKPKHRQSAHFRSNNNDVVDVEQTGQLSEDDWVIVKKQRVTILIPALPAPEQPLVVNDAESPLLGQPTEAINNQSSPQPAALITEETPLQAQPRKSSPEETHTQENAVVRVAKSTPLVHKRAFQARPVLQFSKPSRLMMGSKSLPMINKRMRAVNLERKLQRAGGLTNWLISLGLGHFVKIFHSKNVNKFQLANLTMEKLKDMGSFAVGPRRKLIHHIDCLCHPYSCKHM